MTVRLCNVIVPECVSAVLQTICNFSVANFLKGEITEKYLVFFPGKILKFRQTNMAFQGKIGYFLLISGGFTTQTLELRRFSQFSLRMTDYSCLI